MRKRVGEREVERGGMERACGILRRSRRATAREGGREREREKEREGGSDRNWERKKMSLRERESARERR